MPFAFVVADIHGRFDLLQKGFEKIDKSKGEKDIIVTLGDYIDRGPESKQVIDFLMTRPDVVSLKGNHEDMMLSAIREGNIWHSNWLLNGGDETIKSYGGSQRMVENLAHQDWISRLSTRAEIGKHHFVHAGFMPGIPIEEQTERDMLWIRQPFLKGDHDFGKHVVHGHTITMTPELREFRTNLDTGAFATGVLTIGVFDLKMGGGPIDILIAD